jgi:hypothetical protein
MAPLRLLAWALLLAGLGGCAGAPPRQPDDLCAVFDERRGWYDDARRAERRWGISVPILMAFVRHESSFDEDARPPRRWLLGFIPLGRASSAYGYAQATDAAWVDYRRATGRRGADRDDMGDALDFVGWYGDVSHRTLGIARDDAYRLYLAYHTGHGGYRRGSHRGDAKLDGLARRVASRAETYAEQLARCASRLRRRPWWWPF